MTYIDDLLGDNRTFLDELIEEINMNIDNLKQFSVNGKIYDDIRLFIIYRLMETNYDELIKLNEKLKEEWHNKQMQMLFCNESVDVVL